MFETLFKILSSGSKCPPIGTVRTLSTFLASISQEKWDSDVAPAVVKMTKKSPETSAPLVAVVTTGVADSIDMSEVLEASLLTCLPRMLKSATHTTREAACETIAHASIKCENIATFNKLLTCLLDTLQGKVAGSALTHIYQKEAVLNGVESAIKALKVQGAKHGCEFVQERSDTSIVALLACMEKETDDSIR